MSYLHHQQHPNYHLYLIVTQSLDCYNGAAAAAVDLVDLSTLLCVVPNVAASAAADDSAAVDVADAPISQVRL